MVFIASFKKNEKEDNKDKAKRVAKVGAGTYLGYQSLRSGLPRALGVRLESHTTSRKNARNIKKNGGYLDPSLGGTGSSKAINHEDYINASQNSVHITGLHKDKAKKLPNKIVDKIYPAYRKLQRRMYGSLAGKKLKNPDEAVKSIIPGVLGAPRPNAKTFYVGGSDDYFNNNFIDDPDDIALKTTKKLKVHGNRFSATADAIKREGLGNLLKKNKGRVATGLGILGAGGYGSYKLLKSGLKKEDKKR